MIIKTSTAVTQLNSYSGDRAFKMERTASGRLYLASDVVQTSNNAIDVSWLPAAAEQYVISPNIQDYVICDVPIVHANVPNRNMDEFPLDELMRFDTETGRIAFQTFIGKPAHKDHDNKDPRKAKGVIFDARMVKTSQSGKDVYVVRILKGFDRTKDAALCEEIHSGKRPGHSMGALVTFTTCSYPGCNITSTNGKIACSHMNGCANKGKIVNGYLMYERCGGIRYIESSSVGTPADFAATQHKAWLCPMAQVIIKLHSNYTTPSNPLYNPRMLVVAGR